MQEQTQNTGNAHKVINVNHRSSKEQRRPRITLGRIEDKKSGKVIVPGVKVVGKIASTHPLYGHLKKVVVAKIPAEGGYFLKSMKLKTALQKGYYKVNATDAKTKASIEKALEPFQNTNA
jgi:hypothetical protein